MSQTDTSHLSLELDLSILNSRELAWLKHVFQRACNLPWNLELPEALSPSTLLYDAMSEVEAAIVARPTLTLDDAYAKLLCVAADDAYWEDEIRRFTAEARAHFGIAAGQPCEVAA